MKIHQLLPAWHYGDAIGDNAFSLHQYFLQQNFESRVFVIDADAEYRPISIHFSEFKNYDCPDSILILHFALPSVMTRAFKDSLAKKVLIYHNITPPQFLIGMDQMLINLAVMAREHLNMLIDIPDLAFADSEFSRKELETLGFKNTAVLPIGLDFSKYDVPLNPVLEKLLSARGANFLAVGRITPNKCLEDLLPIFRYYKIFYDLDCRLYLIGKHKGLEEYLEALHKLIDKLNLLDIYFPGHISHQDLVTFYKMSQVVFFLSEHEGFGVPLIEAMYLGVPVIGFNSSAIPYTMGDGGILVNEKDPVLIAELVSLLVKDNMFREKIIQAGKKRALEFDIRNVGAKFISELQNKRII